MISTDLEGTDTIGYPPISEGTTGEPALRTQDLETCEADKLEAFVSEAHRGNLRCGTEFLPGSCKSGAWSYLQRAVRAGTTAFRVRSTLNEPPRPERFGFHFVRLRTTEPCLRLRIAFFEMA